MDELVDVLGPDLPAVIFRSQLADPATTSRLEQLGFSTAEQREPLMVCRQPPAATGSPFRIRRATEDEIRHGIAISSEAHEVDRGMLERTLARTPRDDDGALACLGRRRADQRGVAAVWQRRHRCLVDDDAAPASAARRRPRIC